MRPASAHLIQILEYIHVCQPFSVLHGTSDCLYFLPRKACTSTQLRHQVHVSTRVVHIIDSPFAWV